MLRGTSQLSENPLLARLVDEMLQEDRRDVAYNRRSVHRTPFVRPVSIDLRESPDQQLSGFSKNISSMGIAVFTNQEIAEKSVASIRILRLNERAVSIIADCRWCKKFGHGWFISGWHFLNVNRRP